MTTLEKSPIVDTTEDHSSQTSGTPSASALEAKKSAVISELTEYIRFTFDKLGAHSKAEAAVTLGTIQELRDLNLAALSGDQLVEKGKEIESNLQWLKQEGGIHSQREKISASWTKLNSMLETAIKTGSISNESKEKWLKRFKDEGVGAGAKIDFVNFQLPLLLAHAEKVSAKRKKLLKNSQIKKITPAMVPDLASFFDEQKFLSLHYLERESLAASVAAALAASEKLPVLYAKAKGILNAAVSSGAMGKNKVGKWLESIFKTDRTPKEIESILDGKLKEYIGVWTKLRYRYDRIERQMDKQGVPQGFNRIPVKKFLDLDYFQRESYVDEAERSMKISLDGASNRPIDQLKLRIRHELQVKDWEGAESLISQAWPLAEGEDVYELKSMENYLSQFREKKESLNAPDAQISKTLETMREAIAEAPGPVRTLYVEAMQHGYTTLAALATQMYNLVWCHNNGYLDAQKEEVLYRASFRETERIVKDGHVDRGLENINLDSVDDNKKGEAMRPYKKTWAPTLYHMSCSNGSARTRYLNELRGKNATRDYWSTLKLRDITYEKQEYLVKHVNHKLKSGMKKLKAAGVAFTLSGPPVFMN